MSITAGALSLVSASATQVVASSAVATGGTAPYAYQWYRSTTTGFTPGAGNILSGQTALSLVDTSVIPGTQYYYKVVATDASAATATSAQLSAATTQPVLNPNQFAQQPFLGVIDMRFPYDTVSVEIDASQVGSLYAGQLVKITQTGDGIPKVVGIAADTDEVFGVINFDIKTQQFVAGSKAEISQAGNVIYLYATGAIARGAQVCPDITTKGGVQAATGSSTNNIVGWAYDLASGPGLIRVKLSAPSFAFDG